ncbi:MAG TPA: transcriptional regulator, partial [Syntrophomonas sp.]|nr:transcriptional regulator [Syntrophomonas sp.]
LQGKLLRVLEDKEVVRLGSEKFVKIDVRIVAATNKDLEDMLAKGYFRADLYYRLNVVPITVPPLRERREDISALLAHYLSKFNQKYNVYKSFSREVLQILMDYFWPGNVRELINLVERLVITTRDRIIQPEHLPQRIIPLSENGSPSAVVFMENNYYREQLRCKSMRDILDEVEKNIILLAFKEHKSSRKVGEILGISHTSVINKLRKYKMI